MSDQYIDLFYVDSESNKKKRYKISINKQKTLNPSLNITFTPDVKSIRLSCNCPDFVNRGLKSGRNCKHIDKVWNATNTHQNINPFRDPQTFAKVSGLTLTDNLFNDNIESHIGTIEKVKGVWQITGPSPFVSPKVTIRFRVCVFCDYSQEIPLDAQMFSCSHCHRRQLA